MPRIPTKLIVGVICFSFMWIYLGPKRADLAMRILGQKRALALGDSIRVKVEDKIRGEICRIDDLCEYRPHRWGDARKLDAHGAEIDHDFFQDGALRKYLFRIRYGVVSEVIDLR
jgi:hypothetical protein